MSCYMVTGGNYIAHGEHRVIHRIVESLCCTCETNKHYMSTKTMRKNTKNYFHTWIRIMKKNKGC